MLGSMKRLVALGSVALVLLGARGFAHAADPATLSTSAKKDTRGTVRMLLVVGGKGRDADVRRTVETFVDHGFVRPARVVAVPDASRARVRKAFADLLRVSERYEVEDVMLTVVVAGKGSGDALTLDDGPLPLTEVLTLARDFPAQLRVVMSDLCDPALPTSSVPEISLGRPPGFPSWLRAHGACTSPSATDDLLIGLDAAADSDQNHRITVGEAFAYVAKQANERGGVLTTGAFLDPAGEVVLTHDEQPTAEVVLLRGSGTTYRFFRYGEVASFAEVHSLPDRDVRVRVPSGRVVVHAIRGPQGEQDASGAVELRLSAGEIRFFGPNEPHGTPREQLAQEGGALTHAMHEVSVAYGGGLGGYTGVSHGGMLRYAYAHDTYAFMFVGTAALTGETTQANENLLTVFGGRARVERRFFSGAPKLSLGAGVMGELVAQTLRRRDSGDILLTGYATEERRRAGGVGGEVYASLRTTIGGTSFFGAEISAVFPALPFGDTLKVFPRVEGSAYAGLSF